MKKNNIRNLIGSGLKAVPIAYSEEVSRRNIDKVEVLKILRKFGEGDYGFATKVIKEANNYFLSIQSGDIFGIYKINKTKIMIRCSIKYGKVNCYHVYTLNEYLNWLQEEIETEIDEEIIKILKLEHIKLSR